MKTTKILVQTLVLSPIDYCNSLLLGTPEIHLSKLKRVQNMTCQLICNVRMSNSIGLYLKDLHWLKEKSISHMKSLYWTLNV